MKQLVKGFYLLLLLVNANRKVEAKGPKFLEAIPNVNVTAGRDVTLPCVVDNIGRYKVAWTHIDRHLLLAIDTKTVTMIPRIWVTRDDTRTWTLHIKDVDPKDKGYYVCQVNMEPMINQVGYLQVVVPPTFIDEESTESHVHVKEGDDVLLICRADGLPKPAITWTREDGKSIRNDREPKYAGEKFILRGVSREDMGAYLCIASNKVPPSISKRIVLDVNFTPMITVPNQLIGAPLGASVTIECQVSAFPIAIHYWRFNNQLLINSTRQQTTEMRRGYQTSLQLTVHKLRSSDFGNYICGSKNSLGEAESNLKLYEIVLPGNEVATSEHFEKGFDADYEGITDSVGTKNLPDFGDATSYMHSENSGNDIAKSNTDYLGQRRRFSSDATSFDEKQRRAHAFPSRGSNSKMLNYINLYVIQLEYNFNWIFMLISYIVQKLLCSCKLHLAIFN